MALVAAGVFALIAGLRSLALAGPVEPTEIAAGPDGALWFTEARARSIGRITTSGVISEFPLPKASSVYQRFLGDIAAGNDGNIWFAEHSNIGFDRIYRITPAGAISNFLLPDTGRDSGWPIGVASGPLGRIWFTEVEDGKIGSMTAVGNIKEFVIPKGGAPTKIAVGADGALWYTDPNTESIGRMTPNGKFTAFEVPDHQPYAIVAGPDGNMWFTNNGQADQSQDSIGRITPAGAVTWFANASGALYLGIAAGADGNLWFAESLADKIGRITPAGVISEFALPRGSRPSGVTRGPDGSVWFAELGTDKIGRITPAGQIAQFSVPGRFRGAADSD